MHTETAKLLLYGGLGEDSILARLASVFEDWTRGGFDRAALTRRVNTEIRRLLGLAAVYGFDENLWQCYLTYILMTDENPFSLACERTEAGDGSINRFAKSDFAVFERLFDFDFSLIEADLGIDCLSALTDYRALPEKACGHGGDAAERVRRLRRELHRAENADEVFSAVTGYYKAHGAGDFGLFRTFRIKPSDHGVSLYPISNVDGMTLDDLVGYERQKARLRENTEAFLRGRPANNTLLYGDSGTGKSSSVKALINEYHGAGLRMIELYKHQFHLLSDVIALVKNRNYRFIIFIDDLSFEENEVEYKFLKAVIEGGVETRPENVLIYATSNRRHLIRELWRDRDDMEYSEEVHRSDTLEEKFSLSGRFGVQINYGAPSRREYHEIVAALANRRPELALSPEKLIAEADRWEMRYGGLSGRTAQQFINDLAGRQP